MIRKKRFKLTNQPKLLLTLDWLTISSKDQFKYIKFPADTNISKHGRFHLERVEGGKTLHFNKQLNVWLEGERVAIVTYDASNKMILGGRCHIKFDNILFYDGRIKDVVYALIEDFYLSEVKVSKVDIACDGVYFHEFLNTYLYDKNSHKMGVRRVSDLDNIRAVDCNRESIRNRSFEAFTIGQVGNKSAGRSRSARFIRYYNKTKELEDLNHKQYINEYFTTNGIGQGNQVYRFEVSLSAAYLATIETVEQRGILEIIFDRVALESLFRTATLGYFEFRHDTDKKIERCEKIEFFQGLQESTFKRVKRVVKDSVTAAKRLVKRVVKDLEFGFYSRANSGDSVGLSFNSDRGAAIDWVVRTIERFDLGQWLSYRWSYWQHEFTEYTVPRGLKRDFHPEKTFNQSIAA